MKQSNAATAQFEQRGSKQVDLRRPDLYSGWSCLPGAHGVFDANSPAFYELASFQGAKMLKFCPRFAQSALCFAFIFGAASAAQAQATRTWVSGVGDDVNPCSRTAPCKTFAGAISKTAAGGYIDALDPGGFGTVTITKSITIDGGGFLAGVLASGNSGVVINGSGIAVTLRNLSIESAGTNPGINGVNVLQADEVHIEKCIITGFSNEAVHFAPSGGASGYISDTTVSNNAGGGVVVSSGRVMISNLRAESSANGVFVNGTAIASVRDSYAAGGSVGFGAITAAGVINLENCVTTHNQFGIYLAISAAARVSNTMINSNVGTGLFNDGTGFMISLQGNSVIANPVNGAFTSTTIKQ
jgi:hypothetical protein